MSLIINSKLPIFTQFKKTILSSDSNLLLLLASFTLIAIAANRISKEFQKIGLPIITGILIIGIIAGPFVLQMFPKNAHVKLDFINDIALAFIAFAAGSELYLKELRNRVRQIAWITFGQLVVTFVMSTTIIYFLAENIAFMSTLLGLKNSDLITEKLTNISSPTLIIWGTNDPIIPITFADVFVSSIENCQFYEMNECGHTPYVQEPEKFASYVLKFLNN